MHDLNTITKINNEAVLRDIPAQQANGKYVVAEYHGIHFVGYTAHDDLVSAETKASLIQEESNIGKTATIFHAKK